jgi:hypothetical protein
MKHAVKLTLPPIPIYSQFSTTPQRNVGVQEGYATTLISLHSPMDQLAAVKSVLPKELVPHLMSVTILRVRKCFPHIHVGTGLAAINWYIETNGETTAFHEGNEHGADTGRFEDSKNGYILPPLDTITEVESYVAKEGDTWLINLRTAHSVTDIPNEPDLEKRYKTRDGEFRLMLHAAFNCEYERAKAYLAGCVK